jgi:tetraacyldisaccharide 4'-kinase
MQIKVKFKEYQKYLLFPLALFYWGLVFLRNLFYKLNFFNVHKVDCKVLSIGNLTLGGTGKTPMVVFFAIYLNNLGKKVAILSRGYGRATKGMVLVSKGDGNILCRWQDCGDEPYMIANKLKEVPVLVDENRYRGGLYLTENFNPDIIIMDDGFQHRALHRDLDIVLIDGGDSISQHRLLPYGKLREPWSNIIRADAIIITKKRPSALIKRKIDETLLPQLYAKSIPTIRYPDNLSSKVKVDENIFIISGLGNPKFFEKTVKHLGYKICGIKNFPDHYHYKIGDLDKIQLLMKESGASQILTTEKDWVKLKVFKTGITFGIIDIDVKIQDEEALKEIIEPIC